ncbi:methylated-DNA--[protein]-cysteine S-methyltransferase [Epilithonimonas hominis]|uniref:methylated-DNA--[protein]-cysteine S-methyltransferase n=1 Tax=Epilithonimonas hominis TaxID=420404 RepID=UPI00289F7CCC|nr:methylated-DNA--[protein]-cysteine S-methyltransferase [Epilithonimonas hominis]
MKDTLEVNYQRIAQAISFIKENFKAQPSLAEIANHIHLSPTHFQKIFTDWAGTSPKKFLQYVSLEHAKSLLKEYRSSLFDAAFETGLSGTGRLHDLFVNIEGMTPAEYKNGGKNLNINYSFHSSPFGKILVASTNIGICHMAFCENEISAMQILKNKFPNAKFLNTMDLIQENALAIFKNDYGNVSQIKLHLKGTDFQLKVWEALLKIPCGSLTTYGELANHINHPKASRAVGTAIGSNPVAFIIPCHRVIKSSGNFGDYMWGEVRKTAIIGWESSKTQIEAS